MEAEIRDSGGGGGVGRERERQIRRICASGPEDGGRGHEPHYS